MFSTTLNSNPELVGSGTDIAVSEQLKYDVCQNQDLVLVSA